MPLRRYLHAAVVTAAIAAAPIPATSQQRPTPYGTTIEVSRILTEVRVVDDAGNPIPDLEAGDFRVTIDGRRVEVEAVSWIPMTREAAARAATPGIGKAPSITMETTLQPRLIVVLFQTDINLYKIKGVVRMAPQAAQFVRSLVPTDRVAFLTFESHLQLRADFTVEHEALAKMITTTEILDASIEPPEPSTPRLSDYFNADRAYKAATMTEALEVVAQSLIPLPGPKTLVLFGWGVGRYNPGHRITTPRYGSAIEALAAARTSVFSLDITTADYHTLEIGLRKLSNDTGGIYLKTHLFPDGAMEKLARVISSYYELSILPPPKLERPYRIEVKVERPGARVHVRQNHAAGKR